MNFEEQYEKIILKRYPTNIYDYDYEIVDNDKDSFRIHPDKRLDLTHIRCYTIDPKGCRDADDGFSIWEESGQLKLAIHIADPTHYFTPDSKCFKAILENGVTHYTSAKSTPTNPSVKHLMPGEIVQHASLMDGVKNAISVITEVDPATYLPIGNVEIKFTLVNCEPEFRFTYQESAAACIDDFKKVLKISQGLRDSRDTVGKKLAGLNTINLIGARGVFSLHREEDGVLQMKTMIAELAIFANSAVAQYLKDLGIFRTCDASKLNSSDNNKISAEELLKRIIKKGVSANYTTTGTAHDLVGMDSYLHFTSPIRRATDCVCHYLIKSAYLGIDPPPFTKAELLTISSNLNEKAKLERKIQYDDRKFRTIQVIYNMVRSNEKVILKFSINEYTGLFINIMIESVDEYPIQISYTLKKRAFEHYDVLKDRSISLPITEVNVPQGFDHGTFPELDNYILKYQG